MVLSLRGMTAGILEQLLPFGDFFLLEGFRWESGGEP